MFFKHTTIEDAPLMAGAIVGACRGDGWVMELQPRMLHAMFSTMYGVDIDFETVEPLALDAVLAAKPRLEERVEIVDLMVAVEMICNPLPVGLAESVEEWAQALGVATAELEVARDIARGATAQAHVDLYRSSYFDEWGGGTPDFAALQERFGEGAYCFTVEADPELEAKYEALQACDAGSLGREQWKFYKQRKFPFPGVVGGANLALAQHDWLHVMCDYDSDAVGEVETSAFRAMATDFRGASLALLGDLIFYQSAWFESAASGLHRGHELEQADFPERLADALDRGRACTMDPYAGMNFFDYADRQIDELCATWSIPSKASVRASVDP